MANIHEMAAKIKADQAKRKTKSKTSVDLPNKPTSEIRPWDFYTPEGKDPDWMTKAKSRRKRAPEIIGIEHEPTVIDDAISEQKKKPKSHGIRPYHSLPTPKSEREALARMSSDKSPVIPDALIAPTSPASTTPSLGVTDTTSTTERQRQVTKELLISTGRQKGKKQSVVTQSPLDSHSIANQSSLNSQSVVNQMPASRRRLANDTPTISQRPVNDSSINRQSIVSESSTSSQLIAESIVESIVDESSAKPFLDRLGNQPIWGVIGPAQSSLLLVLYKNCDIKTFTTNMLSRNYLTEASSISYKSVGSTIDKLVARKLIRRLKGEGGTGGFSQLQMARIVYEKMKNDGADYKAESIVTQSSIQSSIQSSLPSRIDRIDLNTNLSNLPKPPEPEFKFEYGDWDDLDLSVLPESQRKYFTPENDSMKFKKDIIKNRLAFTVDQIQDVINRLPVHISNFPGGKVFNPLALFLSILQNRQKSGEDILEGVPTVYEVESRKARLRMREQEKIEMDQEYYLWFGNLTNDQKRAIVQKTGLGDLALTMDVKHDSFVAAIYEHFLNVERIRA